MNIQDIIAGLERIERIESILASIENRLNNQPARETGGIELAQKITGLSKSRIYQLVMAKRIPFNKVPGISRLFFNENDLKNWIAGKNKN